MTLAVDAPPSPPSDDAAAPALAEATAGPVVLAARQLLNKAGRVLLVAADEVDAEAMLRAAATLDPALDCIHLPPWDALPGGRVAPSAGVMGRRVAALRRLAADGGGLVVTTSEALLVRSADPARWPPQDPVIRVGEPLDEAGLEDMLVRLGYERDDRVDRPGEFAIRGEVVEIFPPAADAPVRIDRDGDRVGAIRRYDPVTQRSDGEDDALVLTPAAEAPAEESGPPPHPAAAGPPRIDLLAMLREAPAILAADADERGRSLLAMAAETKGGRGGFRADADLLATAEDWDAFVGRAVAASPALALPDLAAAPDPSAAARDLIAGALERGDRVVVTSRDARERRRLVRALGPDVADAAVARGWDDVTAAAPGSLSLLRGPLDQGFRDPQASVTVLAAADLLGRDDGARRRQAVLADDGEIERGDVVVHEDHGLCIYDGLAAVSAEEGEAGEAVRLCFSGEEALLVPAEQAGLVWRYGSAEADVTLDGIGGDAWRERRSEVEADMARAAAHVAALVAQRDATHAPACRPPADQMARFAGRFPHPATPDQRSAFAEVIADMARTRPMDRLVCGDVGFGKTEVALRAAAAAVFAGRQAVIAAPTTLLARQHLAVFRARFAPFGIEVRELSRFVPPAEARAVKAGLKDGSVRLVVGTHALAGRGIAFADLGLVVIDEEQRFGEAHKAALARLGRGVHTLAMTATPIPRTLQAAIAGLREVSVLATPPVARRPVRTVVAPYDDALLREHLMAERARGGRSFVVCPRIADIAPMRERLANVVPELAVVALHARMPAQEIDGAMLAFAEGEGDVLLATSIVESGLDVPGADTMVLWHPERFGLAQLHQLRGRVGRTRNRGHCLLLTDPDHPPGPVAARRLAALAALDTPGAGFAVAARDLDQRGAGDIAGLDQSGHQRRIGVELSRHLLQRALEGAGEDWHPEVGLGCSVGIPASYVPEPDLRLALYRRGGRAAGLRGIEALADEIEDRFGDPPDEVERWLDVLRVAAGCRALGIARLDCGPKGLALDPRSEPAALRLRKLGPALDPPLQESRERFLWPRGGENGPDRVRVALSLLGAMARRLRKG